VKGHPQAAHRFLKDPARADWHDETLWWVRSKRDLAAAEVREWEQLREAASRIKRQTLENLDKYLVQFEEQATANGIKVHWAVDASEHNNAVLNILHNKDVTKVVKSKSMLTEECGLNPFLEGNGIEVIDTDLGERIVQWLEQKPSHIVMPAIHLKRQDIGEIFSEKLKMAPSDDANVLTEAARQHLRSHFLTTRAALTGVNFGVATTGAFVVCTNEGNADMGVHLADVHIASMGIEKLIPGMDDLGVMLRLLARSATGQPITTYTSLFKSPEQNKEIHLILVDNGRSEILGKPGFRTLLKCIRCGACMNTCPVFRKTGGYSYGSTIPGPIGSILAPHGDPQKYGSLPFASSLCGSCSNVCPVKIDIDKQLYLWRQELTKKRKNKWFLNQVGKFFDHPKSFDRVSKIALWLHKRMPAVLKIMLFRYTAKRDLPPAPDFTFKEWFLKHGK